MSDIRHKRLADDDFHKVFSYVIELKNATEEQKSQFTAVLRSDKAAMKEITEHVANNDLKAARKRATTRFEEYVRAMPPSASGGSQEEDEGFAIVKDKKKFRQREQQKSATAPKHAADGAKGSIMRGDGGNSTNANTRKTSPVTKKAPQDASNPRGKSQESRWAEMDPQRSAEWFTNARAVTFPSWTAKHQ